MTREAPLEKKLTARALLGLAGPVIYARGENYQAADRVQELCHLDGMLSAAVAGSSYEDYQVSLWVENGAVDYSCTCPMGEEGECCKHVVATGLAWLAGDGSEENAASATVVKDARGSATTRKHVRGKAKARDKGRARLKDEAGELRVFLLQQNKETLADWLLAQARSSASLREELKTRALLDKPGADLKTLKQAFDKALRVKDFISYADVRAMVGQVRQLMLRLQHAGKALSSAEKAELAEHAVRKGLAAYGEMDDSSGYFGEFLHELVAWYQKALRASGAAYALNSKTLFDLKQEDDWGYFSLQDFGPLLGKTEYRRYRALAEREWKKVPALEPQGSKEIYGAAFEYFHITRLMEELAEYEGDIDYLVTIMRRQLTSPWSYLQLAEKLQRAKRRDEALTLAEEGIAAFPEHWDSRLVAFLLAQYRQRKQHGKAQDLAWRYFQADSTLEAFKVLKQVTGKDKDWPQWRQRALDWLASIQGHKSAAAGWGRQFQLLEILLSENDIAAAVHCARTQGAGEEQWLRLARACEQADPDSAVEIYRKQVDVIVNRKSNQAYEQAARIVDTLRRLMQRQGQAQTFNGWLQQVRTTHKAKRNFMQRLETVRPLEATKV